MSSCTKISTLMLSKVRVTHYSLGVINSEMQYFGKKLRKKTSTNKQPAKFMFPIVSRTLGKEK